MGAAARWLVLVLTLSGHMLSAAGIDSSSMGQHTVAERMQKYIALSQSRVEQIVSPILAKDLEMDLKEKSTQIRVGAAIFGAFIGSAVGCTIGSAGLASSGGTAEVQDIAGDFWAGALAGGFSAFRQVNTNAADVEADRSTRVKEGLINGMMAGIVAGAFAQAYSGSSADGGSSSSSGSSSPSSMPTESNNDPFDNRKLPRSSLVSQKIPSFHYAFAGAAAGAVVAQFQDLMISQGEVVGDKAYRLHQRGEEFVVGMRLKRKAMGDQGSQPPFINTIKGKVAGMTGS